MGSFCTIQNNQFTVKQQQITFWWHVNKHRRIQNVSSFSFAAGKNVFVCCRHHTRCYLKRVSMHPPPNCCEATVTTLLCARTTEKCLTKPHFARLTKERKGKTVSWTTRQDKWHFRFCNLLYFYRTNHTPCLKKKNSGWNICQSVAEGPSMME